MRNTGAAVASESPHATVFGVGFNNWLDCELTEPEMSNETEIDIRNFTAFETKSILQGLKLLQVLKALLYSLLWASGRRESHRNTLSKVTIMSPKNLITDKIVENKYADRIFGKKSPLRVVLVHPKHSLFLISSFLDLTLN